MRPTFTAAQLADQTALLRQLFDRVLLLDADAAVLLDPITLTPTGPAPLPLPVLDTGGRAWQPVHENNHLDDVTMYFYRSLIVEGRPCLLAVGRTLTTSDPADPRQANAFRRLLLQYQEDLRRDYVTGAYNALYLQDEYRPQAVALAAAGKPLAVALVRVNEYAALCAEESPAAADSCLNTAAGILRTALDPAWEAAVLARWEDGVFLVAAAVGPELLAAALESALHNGRRQFALSLSRRGEFTTALVTAAWAEAGSWEALTALAAKRLANA